MENQDSDLSIEFKNEDHTLGNILRNKLLENKNVLFAAYRMPQPAYKSIELKVQTNGLITTKEVIVNSIDNLLNDIDLFINTFTSRL